MAIATKRLTAEEAVHHAPDGRWELVRGEVVSYMPVQAEQGSVVSELNFQIRGFLGSSDAALIGPEIGLIVARNPDTVRAPDLSVTWPEEAKKRGKGAWIEGGPNLAIEVLSEDESLKELMEKASEYLAAGSELVWVIDPEARKIHVFRDGVDAMVLHPGDILTGEPVLPGFHLAVSDLLGDDI